MCLCVSKRGILIHTLLLRHSKFILVVTEVFSTKQEGKLWVVLLFLHCHFFKFRSIPSDKLGQLIDDVPQFLIWTKKNKMSFTEKDSLVTWMEATARHTFLKASQSSVTE